LIESEKNIGHHILNIIKAVTTSALLNENKRITTITIYCYSIHEIIGRFGNLFRIVYKISYYKYKREKQVKIWTSFVFCKNIKIFIIGLTI